MNIKGIWGAVFLAALPFGVAVAADMPVKAPSIPQAPVYRPAWFVDLGAGVGLSWVNSLTFTNPVGTAFTTNPVSGGDIVLSGVDKTDRSFAATVAVGRFLTSNIYLKAAYRYFGKYDASGFANFPPGGNFQQVLTSTAHGALVSLGTTYDLTQQLYLDASVEIGAAFIRSTGTQGRNLGVGNTFPTDTRTNLAAGAGLGLGYRLTQSLDLTLTGSYHYLGKAATGVTDATAPGMNPGEQLSARLNVISVLAGIRYKI